MRICHILEYMRKWTKERKMMEEWAGSADKNCGHSYQYPCKTPKKKKKIYRKRCVCCAVCNSNQSHRECLWMQKRKVVFIFSTLFFFFICFCLKIETYFEKWCLSLEPFFLRRSGVIVHDYGIILRRLCYKLHVRSFLCEWMSNFVRLRFQ